MKILWQSKSSKVLKAFYEGSIADGINGGNAYDVQSALALSKHFNVVIDPYTIRKSESVFSYWWRLRNYKAAANLVILEPYPIVFGNRTKSQLSIAVIHHIDHSIAKRSLFHRWYFHQLIKKVQKCNAVVTVSEHWRNYFSSHNCSNVSVIYNSFNPDVYNVSSSNEREYRLKHNIPLDKKIVYIGNAIRQKGVVEVYEALKKSDYHLIMTGPRNRVPELNVHYLNLKRADYLQLLKISSVVICFSLMEEGWNRIAHEALLSGTPVIGSDSGGMTELLSKAGQTIVREQNEIKSAVEKVLSQREHFSKLGLDYVKQFDTNYFEKAWLDVLNSVVNKN